MKIRNLGLQLWSVRDSINGEEGVRSSFIRLKEMGYDWVHMAGNGGLSYEDFGKIAKETGIGICGTHDDFGVMLNDPKTAMKNHDALGTKLMGVGGCDTGTVESVEKFIEQANTVGKNIYPYGFKFTYHNHSHEFRKLANGKTAMEMLAEGLDPVTCSFVLDTYWVQHGGGDVRYWIEKLSGRIDILHLKDMGRNNEGPFITEIGNGNLWWEGILEAADKAGVTYYVVEQDSWPGDPFDSVKMSADYLRKNFM